MKQSYKLDLHTHSYGSPDGGLHAHDYRRMLQSGVLDYIAITDHTGIDAAQRIQTELQELGERIIIGQEVSTTEGEVIGLYLRRPVPSGLTYAHTIQYIRRQGGLVYVPHPFETVRSGVSLTVLEACRAHIDIVETHNGRAVFQNKSAAATAWAEHHGAAAAASSDAHGRHGWGRTYTVLSDNPTSHSLVYLLKNAHLQAGTVGVGVIYPTLNRLRKVRAPWA